MNDLYQGGCLCGGVTFSFTEMLPEIGHCHCSMCRKFHGAAFAKLGSVPREGFRWERGEELLKSYMADNGTVRTFCERCGSSLSFYSPRADDRYIEISLGCVQSPMPFRPDAHIFVDSGAPWVAINDALPQYESGRKRKVLNR